ncbi:hypothetical protein LAZ67_17001498 [Cordylochernes scorpioides]|uniref:Uncharacterized protein n=1 Tax=Cordylochernes scorpioides TaxID=51811 RepID=A0ABY6LDF8_9ARAC|nr:hypothetical protein LAZ67_17001498 [Cordylochernes scorpioides]
MADINPEEDIHTDKTPQLAGIVIRRRIIKLYLVNFRVKKLFNRPEGFLGFKNIQTEPEGFLGLKDIQTEPEGFLGLKDIQSELPTFNGRLESWLSFKDLFFFLQLVLTHKYLILKSQLRGEALRLVNTFPITADNYVEDLIFTQIDNALRLPKLADDNHNLMFKLLDMLQRNSKNSEGFNGIFGNSLKKLAEFTNKDSNVEKHSMKKELQKVNVYNSYMIKCLKCEDAHALSSCNFIF